LIVVVRGFQQPGVSNARDSDQDGVEQNIASSELGNKTKTTVYTARNPVVVKDAKLRAEDGCCKLCENQAF